ncbi:MAG: SAM-dependent methyltransferase, partial [Terriglobales bacterium]
EDRVPRHSTGLAEFHRLVDAEGKLRILDLGPTSPTNIAYLTGQGHKVSQEDILRAATSSRYLIKDKDGKTSLDAERFLSENLQYTATVLDAALCWDVADYLPEAFVRPAVARVHRALKPRGVLLAFFHTRDAGPEAPHYRYHLVDRENLDLQLGPQFRLQRVFQNRHIENLFKEFSSVKFFLARDHVREVLAVK